MIAVAAASGDGTHLSAHFSTIHCGERNHLDQQFLYGFGRSQQRRQRDRIVHIVDAVEQIGVFAAAMTIGGKLILSQDACNSSSKERITCKVPRSRWNKTGRWHWKEIQSMVF